jgi:hypothetical protein
MIRFDISPADLTEIMDMVTTMIMEVGPFLASQPGFRGFRSQKSIDGAHIVNMLSWDSRSAHEQAMASPELGAAGGALMEWVDQGRATLDVNMYEVASEI